MQDEQPKLRPTLLQSMGVDFRLPPILGIFLTVFLDMLAFGLFIPDIQLRGEALSIQALGAHPNAQTVGLLIGFTQGVFSLVQLITSPILGRISDRYGRRNVLIISTLLSVASYVIYAHAVALPWMIASRILSGIAAANIGVAFAYIADITAPKDRAKGLGMLGAAFGLGFILGPVTGAFLLKAGHNSPLILGYTAAVLVFLNFLYVTFVLPESLQHTHDASIPLIERFARAFRTPGLGLMLILFFAANFAFTNLETTFFRLLDDGRSIFHLYSTAYNRTITDEAAREAQGVTARRDEIVRETLQGEHPEIRRKAEDRAATAAKETGGIILGIVGVVAAIMQGGVVRRATPKYGEVKLLRFSYLIMAPALALVPFAPLWVPLVIVIIFLGIGTGLAQPSLGSLISRTAPRDMQGGIFGVTQGLGALARFSSPLLSNALFQMHPWYPYLFGAIVLIFPAVASWGLRMPDDTHGGH